MRLTTSEIPASRAKATEPRRAIGCFRAICTPATGPKQLFMLTATPVNNTVHDFRFLIELFTATLTSATSAKARARSAFTASARHFIDLEKRILGKLPKTAQLDLEFGPELAGGRADAAHATCSSTRSSSSAAAPTSSRARCSRAKTARFFPSAARRRLARLQSQGELRPAARKRRARLQQRGAAVFSHHLLPARQMARRERRPDLRDLRRGPAKAGRHPHSHPLPETVRKLGQRLRRFVLAAAAAAARVGHRPRRDEDDARHLERWKRKHGELIDYEHAASAGSLARTMPRRIEAEELLTEDLLDSIDTLVREALRHQCDHPRYHRGFEPARGVSRPAGGRETRARRQAQGAHQTAENRQGVEARESAHLLRVRRHRPLSSSRS